MKNLRYINGDVEAIKKVCKVYNNEELKSHKDENIRNLFGKYDYLIEVKDINTIIDNSVLKSELAKIQALKVKFEEVNTSMLRERIIVEGDELEETSDREILNRSMVMNLRRRKINFTNQDSIYLKNQEDESYNEIKSYYLNITLPYSSNRNFEAISNGLRRTIASAKQEFTTFKPISLLGDRRRKYIVVLDELLFNNERFTKELYKVFLPYLTLVNAEIIQALIKESDSWSQYGYDVLSVRDSRVVDLNGAY